MRRAALITRKAHNSGLFYQGLDGAHFGLSISHPNRSGCLQPRWLFLALKYEQLKQYLVNRVTGVQTLSQMGRVGVPHIWG